MSSAEILATYRSKQKELAMVRKQLEACGSDGRPSGVNGFDYEGVRRSTNDVAAAARQLYEGLLPIAARLEDEIGQLKPRVDAVISSVADYKTRNLLNLYYCCGLDDAQISGMYFYCTRHINRLRNNALKQLDG